MIIAGKYEIPDLCPEDCRFFKQPFYQGDMCTRCPVFNCTEDVDGNVLIRPEDYREDWAEEWEKFFKTGELPELYLQRKEHNK